LGGGMVGTHAGDMIGEIALAAEMGADAVDIGKSIHPTRRWARALAWRRKSRTALARMCRPRGSDTEKHQGCYLFNSCPRNSEEGFADFLCGLSIVSLHWDVLQFDTFKATDIHSRHRVAFRIETFAKGVYAACGAKVVLDDVLMKGVGGHLLRWC